MAFPNSFTSGFPLPAIIDEDEVGTRPLMAFNSQALRESKSCSCIISEVKAILPTLPPSGCIPRISVDTFANVKRGLYDDRFDKLHVIDCRFDYEYDGGHIKDAVNFTDPHQFVEQFFGDPEPNALIIFHCEFSHNRGPQMAMAFRNYDREVNKHRYPYIHYPNVYIIDGGYRDFYEAYGDQWCDGEYIPMIHDVYCKNGSLARARNELKMVWDGFNFKSNCGICPRHKSHLKASLHSPKKSSLRALSSPVRRSMYARGPIEQFMM